MKCNQQCDVWGALLCLWNQPLDGTHQSRVFNNTAMARKVHFLQLSIKIDVDWQLIPFLTILFDVFLVRAAAIPIKIFSATLLEYFSSLFVHKSLESLSFRPLKCFVSLATEREKQKFAKFCFSHFIRKNTFFDTKVLKLWVHFFDNSSNILIKQI